MIQLKTQTQAYWEHDFTLTESDIEQLYNHFLETEKPQTMGQLVDTVITAQLLREKSALQQRLAGRSVYQPMNQYALGDELVFPSMGFAFGEVVDSRAGFNPDEGAFKVISVSFGKKTRKFATELQSQHVLNTMGAEIDAFLQSINASETASRFRHLVEPTLLETLQSREEFIYLSGIWFIKPLLADINVGHLNLAEAVLDFEAQGGPMGTDDILANIGLDESIDPLTQAFSLNYALLNDNRFDEVALKGQVAWFLRRMEPDAVRETPEVLLYDSADYESITFSSHMLLLERELADEWSDLPVLPVSSVSSRVMFSLIYPHRASGTLPLNSTIRAMLPLGRSPRQLIKLIDADTDEELDVWAIPEARYLYGLGEWYEAAGVPIGGHITVETTAEPGVLSIRCGRRRRPKREDVRLASVVDNRLQFDLSRRSIACDYDDLMVVGTDYRSAVEAFARRVNDQGRSLGSLLAMIMPELADLTPQQAVHAKTIYSAVNMLRRTPPGPIFAELLRYPAFQSVGDQYWMFDRRRWQKE